jgi:hypothetical protein
LSSDIIFSNMPCDGFTAKTPELNTVPSGRSRPASGTAAKSSPSNRSSRLPLTTVSLSR